MIAVLAVQTLLKQLDKQGVETIVTDHHLIPASGPPKKAIVVNPSQASCNFDDKSMAGVGIAYYLAIAIRAELREQDYFSEQNMELPNLKHYLDLVALGTIADQAAMIGQNRIFVTKGLVELKQTNKNGLRALLNLSLPIDRDITADTVAFNVAPKINAAGRLGFAKEAFELLVEGQSSGVGFISSKAYQVQ